MRSEQIFHGILMPRESNMSSYENKFHKYFGAINLNLVLDLQESLQFCKIRTHKICLISLQYMEECGPARDNWDILLVYIEG